MSATEYTKPNPKSVEFPKFFEALPSQTGKVFAITGTTSGTGNAAAETLGKKGAAVVLLLNRPSSRSAASLAALQQAAPATKYIAVDCDLQSFESVKAAAGSLATHVGDEGIDVLINNAGVMALKDERTGDGYDVQIQTNHLSHFLLTILVFPLLEKAAAKKGEARIVNHSSLAAHGSPFEAKYFEKCEPGTLGGDGDPETMFGGPRWARYHQTKLANQLFTKGLVARLANKNSNKVIALSAHPGVAVTELSATTVKHGGMGGGARASEFMQKAQSQEDGSIGILHAAAMPNLASGDYFGPEGMVGPAIKLEHKPEWSDPDHAEALWKVSVAATGVGGDF